MGGLDGGGALTPYVKGIKKIRFSQFLMESIMENICLCYIYQSIHFNFLYPLEITMMHTNNGSTTHGGLIWGWGINP